jgi:hypothetical protein
MCGFSELAQYLLTKQYLANMTEKQTHVYVFRAPDGLFPWMKKRHACRYTV